MLMGDERLREEPGIIDVDSIFRQKSPNVYRLMPGFILGYIKRTIHQDEINDVLVRFSNMYGLDFISHFLEFFGIAYTVSGEENIPGKGRFIFVSNHPLGGLDGLVFMDMVGKHHKNVKFIVNDLLLNLKNLEPVFIPVNKHGRQSADYVRRIEEVYRSDDQILYFPAGLCSRKKRGEIKDLEWKKNFIKKATDHQRDIVPVHFEGRNSSFFYNFANLRQSIGIKTNIEMFYLPDELFRQKGHKFHVTIGRPIPYATFDKSQTHAKWAEFVRGKVYSLAQNRSAQRR
jgi:putative hemolysin